MAVRSGVRILADAANCQQYPQACRHEINPTNSATLGVVILVVLVAFVGVIVTAGFLLWRRWSARRRSAASG